MADAREIIQGIFDDVLNRRDIDAADELVSEDFVDHGPMGDMHGREGVEGVFRQWLSGVPEAHRTVEKVIGQGDLAGWLVRTTGTHSGDGLGFPATGKSFETVAVNMGRFRDGVAVEHWSEQGLFPMLVQIGVMSIPGA